MPDPQFEQTIEGLPPGAILKPIQPKIEGLPAGAILKPVGQPQLTPVTVTSPYGREESMQPAEASAKVKQGYAIGPAAQQPKTPMFTEKGDYVEVPNNVVAAAKNQGWQPAVKMSLREGDEPLNLPPRLQQAAQNVGFLPYEQAKSKRSFLGDLTRTLLPIGAANPGFADKARQEYDNPGALGTPGHASFEEYQKLSTPENDVEKAIVAAKLPLTVYKRATPDEQEVMDAIARSRNGAAWEDKFAQNVPFLGAQVRAAVKSAQSFKGGNVSEGLGHAGAAALPILGPMAEQSGEQIGAGETRRGLMSAGVALAPLLKEPAGRAATGVIEGSRAAGTRTLSTILGGGQEAASKAPIPQQPAAGAATNLEVAQYAKSKGIDLLPGQATQAKGLQSLQAIGERSIVAPGKLPEVLEQQKAAFGNAVDDFKTRVGTEAIPDTEAAGTSLQSQAHHGLDQLKQAAQADYQAFQAKAGDIPVDLGEVKAKYAQKLADQAEALKNVPAKYANPVRNVLNKLSGIEAGGPVDARALADFQKAVGEYGLNAEQQVALREKMGLPTETTSTGVKMSTAQQLRSAYLDIARDYSGNVPKAVQRLAGEAAKDIDAAMAKAADSVGATDQWRQANAKWKQLQQTYNNPEHPLYKIIQEPDSVKVPSKLLGKGSYGGSPNNIRQLQQAGIDVSPLKREVAQQIADKNFSLTNGGRGLGGYSTEFLRTLFTPDEFNELTTLGRIGRSIKFEVNPSGTSNVIEGRHQLMGILHGTLGATVGPIASRITTSKALARAAMPGLDTVAPSPSFLRIIRGQEPPPQLPPPSAPPESGPPAGPSTPPISSTPRSFTDILRGPQERAASPYAGPERRSPGRSLTSRIGEFRKELLTEKDPAKRAELEASIAREIAFESGQPSEPIPHKDLPTLEETQRHAREAPPIGEYQRGLNSTPEGMIRSAGLVNKGEVSPGSGVYMFEDPAHPGKTASMSTADMQKAGIAGIKAKMQAKLAEFKKPGARSMSDILGNKPRGKGKQ